MFRLYGVDLGVSIFIKNEDGFIINTILLLFKMRKFILVLIFHLVATSAAFAWTPGKPGDPLTQDEAMQKCQAFIPTAIQIEQGGYFKQLTPADAACEVHDGNPQGYGAIWLTILGEPYFTISFWHYASSNIELGWVLPVLNPADGPVPSPALGAIVPSKIRGVSTVHYSTATLKAVVKSSSGTAVAGAQVLISIDVTPLSGYHNHASATRPKGILSTDTIPISFQKIQIPGTTDANGEFKFYFTATDFAAEHKITASCTDQTCNQQGKNTVVVRVPGLVPLAENMHLYILRGASSTHQSNHNFTSAAQNSLVELATRFRDENGGTLLLVNDGSLPMGGLYDFTNNWANPHKAHRRGVVVDINNFTTRNTAFENLCKDLGIFPSWEGGSHPHYHLWLIGQDA